MSKPKLAALWAAFPDHGRYPTLGSLYRALGGSAERNIAAPGFGESGNACASRLSVAFNRASAPISVAQAAAVGATTVGAADGSRIIFRVFEFRRYLLRVLGPPSIDSATPFDSQFRGKRGIIAFAVNWRDASGHIALWNGQTYREASGNYATYVSGSVQTSRGEFWELD